MKPVEIINIFYESGSPLRNILIRHGEQVSRKALAIAAAVAPLSPDLNFLHEAAMLHDIGIFLTDAQDLGCTGSHPYVLHGNLGRILLERQGLPRHALVCERHVGVGLSVDDIRANRLALPVRDMLPVTLEEKIICFADKFYSKGKGDAGPEKTVSEIAAGLEQYGKEKAERFMSWARLFKQS
jgi:uncharacterized protein